MNKKQWKNWEEEEEEKEEEEEEEEDKDREEKKKGIYLPVDCEGVIAICVRVMCTRHETFSYAVPAQ